MITRESGQTESSTNFHYLLIDRVMNTLKTHIVSTLCLPPTKKD